MIRAFRTLLASFLIAALGIPCHAAVYIVDNNDDPPYTFPTIGGLEGEGPTSLRTAIAFANDNPGPDEIRFSAAIFNGQAAISIYSSLQIEDDLSISNENGALNIRLNGDDAYTGFDVGANVNLEIDRITINGYEPAPGSVLPDRGRLMYVHPGAQVFLNSVSIYQGWARSKGGGIYIEDSSVFVYGNVGGNCRGDGGGVYVDHGVLMVNGTIGGDCDGRGGAVFNDHGIVVFDTPAYYGSISGTALTSGGAVYSDGGIMTIQRYEIYNSEATSGAALYLAGNSQLSLSQCSFYNNSSIEDGGAMNVNVGSVWVTNCTFGTNTAGTNGGALYIGSASTATILNCTFTKNNAVGLGGGLYSNSPDTLLGNVIVADNKAHLSAASADFFGPCSSLGYNLVGIGDAGTGFAPSDHLGTVAQPIIAKLDFQVAPNNSSQSPPRLYVPVEDSPAINAGSNALLQVPEFTGGTCYDNRSDCCPRLRDGVVDIGAIETQEGEITPTCTGTYSADFDHDKRINLTELLRAIQLYNAREYHCEPNLEDHFAPGPGDQTCAPHTADNNSQDWTLSLAELLRIIQFYATGGYHPCPGEDTEDGFCPGA